MSAHERRDAAGVLRRNLRAARDGKGHQVRRLGPGLVKPRIGESKGGGHEAHRALTCDGKTVHIVGIPLHWGFMGATRKGFGPNSLTPYVGDANIETPEYKAFLVDIEPISGPVS